MDLFEVGEIVKTRGLCGCLKILSYLKSGNKISKPDVVYIEKTPGQKNRFCLNKMEQSRNALFIELEGINDVNSAGHLIGGRVYFSKDVLKNFRPGSITFTKSSALMFTATREITSAKSNRFFPPGAMMCMSAGRQKRRSSCRQFPTL